MTRAVKAVSTYRGRDPRDFALFAFGGNGPVVGAAIAAELDIVQVIVPRSPGVFSALGLLLSESEYDFARTVTVDGGRLQTSELADAYMLLEREACATLTAEGISTERVRLTRFADMRYLGQAYELTVPVPDPLEIGHMVQSFMDEHRRTYGHAADDPVQVVSVRVVARNGHEKAALGSLSGSSGRGSKGAQRGEREVFFGPEGPLRTPVVDRDALEDRVMPGPLIVEEYDATCVVPPGWSAHLDALRNIVLEATR
jgi:N-methylhydantoinase A